MAISVQPPEGGIIAQFGSRSYPLVLRNGEIERFEEHFDLSIFKFLRLLLADEGQVRMCRDLVALGLVGAGMADQAADLIVQALPPHQNIMLRGFCRELILAAFVAPEAKKKDTQDGSQAKQVSRKSTVRPKAKKTP